jgi:hypothetical protein
LARDPLQACFPIIIYFSAVIFGFILVYYNITAYILGLLMLSFSILVAGAAHSFMSARNRRVALGYGLLIF